MKETSHGSVLSHICVCVLCNCMDGQMRVIAGASVVSVDGACVVRANVDGADGVGEHILRVRGSVCVQEWVLWVRASVSKCGCTCGGACAWGLLLPGDIIPTCSPPPLLTTCIPS